MTTTASASVLIPRFEERLSELVPNVETNALFAAARYSLFAPSKRLRPLFLLQIAECYGADPECALNPACALEMVHTYSLIHDDLPCMDDDDMRRGKPSLHKAYPEGHAMLTGDFLLTFAFEILASSPVLNAEQRLALIQTLSRCAGVEGMAGGQADDLKWQRTGYRPNWQELSHMLYKKTAALFSCAFEMGGIVAGAPPDDLDLLQDAGMAYGLAFQIQDDIADQDGAYRLLELEAASNFSRELLASAKSSLPSVCQSLTLDLNFS